MECPDVAPKQIWAHHNGNQYEVLMLTNTATLRPWKYPVTVVYRNVIAGTEWSRPLHDWHRSFTYVRTK